MEVWIGEVERRFAGFEAVPTLSDHGSPVRRPPPSEPFNRVAGQIRAARTVSLGRAVEFVDAMLSRLSDEKRCSDAEIAALRASAPLQPGSGDNAEKRIDSIIGRMFERKVRDEERDEWPAPPIVYPLAGVPWIVRSIDEINRRNGVGKVTRARLRAAYTRELESAQGETWARFERFVMQHFRPRPVTRWLVRSEPE